MYFLCQLLNPVKTIEVIGRFKIVLNYITEEIQKEFVEMEGEIELVKHFIQLEKLRYGDQLNVSLDVNGNMKLLKIPPMILFLLIENSFKHGISLDAGSPWINVEIKSIPGEITLEVENSKSSNPVKLYAEIYRHKFVCHFYFCRL